jgi:hypothetical protein
LPSVDRLHAELSRDGLTILLVNLSEPRETVVRALPGRAAGAPVLLDPTGEAAEAYRVRGSPTTYFVGRDGKLLGGAIGPRPWAEPAGP